MVADLTVRLELKLPQLKTAAWKTGDTGQMSSKFTTPVLRAVPFEQTNLVSPTILKRLGETSKLSLWEMC